MCGVTSFVSPRSTVAVKTGMLVSLGKKERDNIDPRIFFFLLGKPGEGTKKVWLAEKGMMS